jgi:alkanesulfonate monooxygenase SsuD/methylene tetrahydromethanopterin reductase-like flavin-dependent oxidoreductase (luciferase family)
MGISPIDSTLPAVRAAEHFGLDGIWSAEHIGFHDAIVPSALYLRETEQLEVAVVGISTAGRHPGLIAMELSSLAELGPGRVRVQVGTGDPSLVAKLGKEVVRPARSTEELVQALRAALGGDEYAPPHAWVTDSRSAWLPHTPTSPTRCATSNTSSPPGDAIAPASASAPWRSV